MSMMMPEQGQQPMDPQMLALLAQLGGGAGGGMGAGMPEMAGEPEQQTNGMPSDIVRQMIELAHTYVRVEPDAADKAIMGKLLAQLLSHQQKQIQQGQ